MMSHIAYILIGSNKGNRLQMLNDACEMINDKIGIIINRSSVYQTQPWKLEKAENFYNQVILVNTTLLPMQLLNKLQIIELILGRVRYNEFYESRPIDLDILFYGHKVVNEANLNIPHLLFHERLFALVPMAEIADNFIHPVKQVSIAELLQNCRDKGRIEKVTTVPS